MKELENNCTHTFVHEDTKKQPTHLLGYIKIFQSVHMIAWSVIMVEKQFCSVVTVHELCFNVGISSIRQCLHVKHFVYSGCG
jgi:hypothetical protein